MNEAMNTVGDDPSIGLLRQLVQRESVTPDDCGCQEMIGARLQRCGFALESMPSGGVTNLWARRGTEAPLFVFAGHTDVVPTGDLEQWTSPPFSGEIIGDYLYGRGAADMKGGLAAMITAIERFISSGTGIRGSMAVLLTSDEEGPATDGTRFVIERLMERGESIDYCIVGEPSSNASLGDTIRHGRRGSLGARLHVHGRQGHVAYPHLADNPVHRIMPALAELVALEWDQGNDHFPPTTLQISNIHAGTGATNVIPGEVIVDFNLRYSPETSRQQIADTVMALCERHGLNSRIEWTDSAHPFMTEPGTLTDLARRAIEQETGHTPTLDTAGGTSDGRFIAPTGAQVIELGPINATIHQVDECISCTDIITLSRIYESVLKQLLGNSEE